MSYDSLEFKTLSISDTKENLILENSDASNVLKIGDNNSRVRELKINLALLGFVVSNNPNNRFGPSTESKVKLFQKYYGLKITGQVDNSTLAKIEKTLSSPYRNGGKHESVIQLKKDLDKLGFKISNNPNQNYGPSTTQKVKEFQSFYKLVASGIADEVTLNKIKTLLSTPMKRGDYRQDAIHFKEKLAKLGFVVSANPTPAYGPSTERMVKEFQKYYGLSQSGVADANTLGKVDSLLKNSIKRGSNNDNVLKMKQDIRKLGFIVSANPNTVFGPSTEKTVKDFQKYYGLRITGVVEEKTFEKITEILNSPFKNGQSHEDTVPLKLDMERLGFIVSNEPNTRFGPTTERQMRELQQYYGLKVNGIGDSVTLDKIQDILINSLQRGSKNNKVKKLKEDLAILGFKVSNNPNQNFGPSTETKVREFQQKNGLVVNGIIDSVTQNKINELIKLANKKIKIFIDAGHGGSDPGALGNGLKESQLTLDIAKRIEKLLKQYKNVEIKMSRTTDKFVSLKNRTKMANDWGADFFLSVHINAGGGTGFETHIHNKNATADAKNKQSIIHDYIMNGLKSDNIRDRGKKDSNFHVLRESKMSALLVEYMFIDNKTDASKLKSTPFKNKLARLTAEGIARSFGLRK